MAWRRALGIFIVNANWRFDDVFKRGQMIEQIEVLEHHADARLGRALLRDLANGRRAPPTSR